MDLVSLISHHCLNQVLTHCRLSVNFSRRIPSLPISDISLGMEQVCENFLKTISVLYYNLQVTVSGLS